MTFLFKVGDTVTTNMYPGSSMEVTHRSVDSFGTNVYNLTQAPPTTIAPDGFWPEQYLELLQSKPKPVLLYIVAAGIALIFMS